MEWIIKVFVRSTEILCRQAIGDSGDEAEPYRL
jgi:hypothetical protein